MNFHEGKLHLIFTWVYIVIATTFLWLLGTILGLGIFSVIPSTVTTFDIFNEVSQPRKRDRLKIWSFWKNRYYLNIKKHWKASLSFSILFSVLTINYVYLNFESGLLSYFLFYITILLIILFGLIWLWFTYISSYYPDLSVKKVLVNSISYTMVYLFEMIIMTVLLVALYLFIWEITPGLLVFAGIGGTLAAINFIFTLIHDGHNFKEYTKNIWERLF